MKCPFCNKNKDRVVDSRTLEDGGGIRRRRLCTSCKRRYTTYERIEEHPLCILKRDGQTEQYDRQKLIGGILKACHKRRIPMASIGAIVSKIEAEVFESSEKQVPSKTIGELVMRELKQTDDVAYVRFASVYRNFKDAGDFISVVRPIQSKDTRGAARP
jgi:transcriptional repressor NrdR